MNEKENIQTDILDNAVANAKDNTEKLKENEEKILAAIPKRRKSFTFILIASKLIVFAAFLWVSVAMFRMGQTVNGSIIIFAVALWLILNEIDKGG